MTNMTIALNRRARFDYALEDDLEVGIKLLGSEVKSLRQGGSSIAESHVVVEDGELWLHNAHIPEYGQAKTFQHEPRRIRKLLAKKAEIAKLARAVDRQGATIVPIVIYSSQKGIMKMKIAVGIGKKKADKRETSAKRDWGRQQQRLLKSRVAA